LEAGDVTPEEIYQALEEADTEMLIEELENRGVRVVQRW
jgi:hypothetical protein